MKKFFGRSNELNLLENYYKQKKAKFIAVYGRRRVGKSYLISKFAENKKFYKFSGLPPSDNLSDQDQKQRFADTLLEYSLPQVDSTDWYALFQMLAMHIKGTKCVVFFDEISWMADKDPTFLPKLKSAWDDLFKHQSNVVFIVCGSISSWIEKNILSSTGFVGRIDHVISLKPLSLKSCNQFWGKRTTSNYEKFKTLCITGGIPLYLDAFDMKKPLDENLKYLCFSEGALLLREFEAIFSDLFDSRAKTYKEIMLAIAGKPMSASQISTAIKWSQSGALTNYLDDLETAGFIRRDYCWDFATSQTTKLSQYRIDDNYSRFYLKCLQPLLHRIETKKALSFNSNDIPNWHGILGLQFENLVLQNRHIIWHLLGLSDKDVVYDNPYFQNKTSKQQGCQIDYLIQTRFNTLIVIEVKFSKEAITKKVISEVKEKIARLKRPKSFSCFSVLIHVNGACDSIIEEDYFMNVIDFADLLKQDDIK